MARSWNFFRYRGEHRHQRRLIRRKLAPSVAGSTVKLQATHTGVEVLVAGTPKVRDTQTGAEVLVAQTAKVRSTQVGVEVLVEYPLPVVTTKFVSHIYEDYV